MQKIHQIEFPHGVVALAFHEGDQTGDPAGILAEDHLILEKLSPRKRREWISSRELLFRISGLPERVSCIYDDFGKPFLPNIPSHISVSHSGQWAAAMISKLSCGVDIQVYSETVQRIADRFLSHAELDIVAKSKNQLHCLHVLWGAKECMYKAYGKKKLEFKSHIHINSLDMQKLTATGEIRYENIHLSYEIHFRLLPEAAWVFCFLPDHDPSLSAGGLQE